MKMFTKFNVATRCHMAKMHEIRFRLGLHSRPRWGSSQLDLRGPTPKGRVGRGIARRKEGRGMVGRGMRAGEVAPPPITWLTSPNSKFWKIPWYRLLLSRECACILGSASMWTQGRNCCLVFLSCLLCKYYRSSKIQMSIVNETVYKKSHESFQMIYVHCRWPWRCFKVITQIVWYQISRNGAFYGKRYYRPLIGSYTLSFDWCHFRRPCITSGGQLSVGCHFHVQHVGNYVFNSHNFIHWGPAYKQPSLRCHVKWQTNKLHRMS